MSSNTTLSRTLKAYSFFLVYVLARSPGFVLATASSFIPLVLVANTPLSQWLHLLQIATRDYWIFSPLKAFVSQLLSNQLELKATTSDVPPANAQKPSHSMDRGSNSIPYPKIRARFDERKLENDDWLIVVLDRMLMQQPSDTVPVNKGQKRVDGS